MILSPAVALDILFITVVCEAPGGSGQLLQKKSSSTAIIEAKKEKFTLAAPCILPRALVFGIAQEIFCFSVNGK